MERSKDRTPIATLRAKNQITIPGKIAKEMELWEGDTFEVTINKEKGIIELMPVAIYPEQKIKEWDKDFEETMKLVKEGKWPVFDSAEEMINHIMKNSK